MTDLTREQKLELYRYMRLNRVVEERLVNLYRQGKVVGGLYRSLGQEATSVGSAYALRKGDIVGPLIRNMGVVLVMGYSARDVMTQYMARGTSPSGGKDCNLHFGRPDRGVISPISMLGALIPVMAGIALAGRMQKKDLVAMTWIGDGGTSTGAFHEGLNFAAVQKLPLVVVAENNGWAYSTPFRKQTASKNLVDKAIAYGIPGEQVDGNDVLAVHGAARRAVDRARGGEGPTLIEAHDLPDEGPRRARRAGVRAEGRARGVAPPRSARPLRARARRLGRGGRRGPRRDRPRRLRRDRPRGRGGRAEPAPLARGRPEERLRGRHPGGRAGARAEKPVSSAPHFGGDTATPAVKGQTTYVDAIREGIREEMARDPRVFLLGEDIGVYGGAFKVTDGLIAEFGEERVIDTPIAETAIVGAAVGAAMMGMRPVAEMQFIDFISCAFDMITNFAAKSRYRTGVGVPLVIRGPSGGGVHGGPFHSQNPEAYFAHTPGLKIVQPATAYDAKGLIKAAIRDDDPVLFFEHKFLYRRIKEELPTEDYVVPIGKAVVRRPGRDLSIITYGAMMWTALEAAKTLEAEGIDAEVVDLRTLFPMDEQTVIESVAKTNKAILLHEATRTGGIGAEIAAVLSERCFEYLDGPLMRVTAPDTPVPYSPPLEEFFLPNAEKVCRAARALVAY